MAVSRIVLIVLWFLSLVGISYYGGPAAYGFFAAVTAVPIVSFLYLMFVLIRFKVYQEVDRSKIVASNISKFFITLQNEDYIPFVSIRAIFYSSFSHVAGIDESAEYELMPRSGIRKETGLLCRYRGEYEVGIKSIVIQDYLKLFKITYKNREPFSVEVLPRIIVLENPKTIEQVDSDPAENQITDGEPDSFVRDYMQSDGMKRIHWKASASAGKLLTRKIASEEKQGIAIVMDSARYSDEEEEYIPLENKMCELVIALSRYFAGNNTPVNLYTYSGVSGLNENLIKDISGFKSFYESFSHFRFEEDQTKERLFANLMGNKEIYAKKTVIMVLHGITKEAAELVKILEQNNVTVVVYDVRGERKEDKKGVNRDAVKESSKDYSGLFRAKVFAILAEADLKEVL